MAVSYTHLDVYKRQVKAPHADTGDERSAEEKNVLPCSGFLIVHRMVLLFEKAPAAGRFFGISVIGSCGPRRSSAYPCLLYTSALRDRSRKVGGLSVRAEEQVNGLMLLVGEVRRVAAALLLLIGAGKIRRQL